MSACRPTTSLELLGAAAPSAGHRPWPRFEVDAGALGRPRRRLRRRPVRPAGAVGPRTPHGPRDGVRARDAGAWRSPHRRARRPISRSWRAVHPPAIRLERAIRDLWGLAAEGSPDPALARPRWPAPHQPAAATAAPYHFLPVEGEGLHQIPVGPVHAGIIEPGHFRFTANGETVVRLEQRLGYVHKGIERLLAAPTSRAAPGWLAGSRATAPWPMRLAFARAVEAATGIEPPPRGAMAAGDDGRAGADRQPPGRLRLRLQRRRLRADPRPLRHPARGGAAGRRRLLRPPPDDGPGRAGRRRRPISTAPRRRGCAGWSASCATRSPSSSVHYDGTPSLQDRTVGTGIVSARAGAPIRRPAAMSAAPRAGRSMPAATLPYAPYDDAGVRGAGARRGRRQCARLDPHAARSSRASLCSSSCWPACPAGRSRGAGRGRPRARAWRIVEAFRGDVLVWVRLDADGRIAALPPARPVLVPVAAAGGRDRGQHRRRLPALQQELQLLLRGLDL